MKTLSMVILVTLVSACGAGAFTMRDPEPIEVQAESGDACSMSLAGDSELEIVVNRNALEGRIDWWTLAYTDLDFYDEQCRAITRPDFEALLQSAYCSSVPLTAFATILAGGKVGDMVPISYTAEEVRHNFEDYLEARWRQTGTPSECSSSPAGEMIAMELTCAELAESFRSAETVVSQLESLRTRLQSAHCPQGPIWADTIELLDPRNAPTETVLSMMSMLDGEERWSAIPAYAVAAVAPQLCDSSELPPAAVSAVWPNCSAEQQRSMAERFFAADPNIVAIMPAETTFILQLREADWLADDQLVIVPLASTGQVIAGAVTLSFFPRIGSGRITNDSTSSLCDLIENYYAATAGEGSLLYDVLDNTYRARSDGSASCVERTEGPGWIQITGRVTTPCTDIHSGEHMNIHTDFACTFGLFTWDDGLFIELQSCQQEH